MPERPLRLVTFVSAEVEPLSEVRCRAVVQLAHRDGRTYAAEAEGGCDEAARLRLVAQTAADCVRRVVGGEGDKIDVTGTTITEAFGKRSVFVHVNAVYLGQRRELLGFCLIDPDVARAAALAVLNAINRFLGIG